ncbi:MAG: pyridine nucleotide-disulfide oxidoreductase, partial [Cyclobacteriaceae bacterium]
MNKIILLLWCFSISIGLFAQNHSFLIEAESFDSPGGWVVDPQFVEQMGSPYLMAHGMGEPVNNAFTKVKIAQKGKYHIWARTKNWAPGDWEAPGRFKIKINGSAMENTLGLQSGWSWEYAGEVDIES